MQPLHHRSRETAAAAASTRLIAAQDAVPDMACAIEPARNRKTMSNVYHPFSALLPSPGTAMKEAA